MGKNIFFIIKQVIKIRVIKLCWPRTQMGADASVQIVFILEKC